MEEPHESPVRLELCRALDELAEAMRKARCEAELKLAMAHAGDLLDLCKQAMRAGEFSFRSAPDESGPIRALQESRERCERIKRRASR